MVRFEERAYSKPAKTGVAGIGINDADYPTSYTQDGVKHVCPFYATWASMLHRCYKPGFKPASDLQVVEEWKTFSKFKAWMQGEDYEGRVLDKDMLKIGNKVYGPETCLFITKAKNTLVRNPVGSKPTGVHKRSKNSFAVMCKLGGVMTKVGIFKTEKEAQEAYIDAKLAHMRNLAALETNEKVKQALLNLPRIAFT